MSDLTFHGVWRMDWGFGNPNKTAAFIALLMIAVWVLAYIRKWGFWLSLAGFIILGVALVHTFSRGGLVSVAAGMIPVLVWAPRPWARSRLIAAVLGFWIIIGASIYLKAHERYTQGVTAEDRSISNRFQLWKAAPAMMANAPQGWGVGNSGNAYMQWYQPLTKSETYRTLVNSHLTWLVEFGWPIRFLYIFGWSFVFLICWPTQFAKWRTIALGVWLCLFVAAFFSSVAESWVMWIIPCVFLAAALTNRIWTRRYPLPIQWIYPFAATIIISFSIWIIGQLSPSLIVSRHAIVIGDALPGTWIYYDPATMGTLYGKSLRAARISQKNSDSDSVGLVLDPQFLPKLAGKTLVIGSVIPNADRNSLIAAIKTCKQLILLSPKFFPQEIGVDATNREKVRTYFGEFSQSPSIEAWRLKSVIEQLPGVGDFLPNWTSFALAKTKTYGNL